MVTWAGFGFERPRVMGILNVTPDSFSDGGRDDDPVDAGLEMIAAGADIIDVGGESTRPNAAPVTPEEEQARIIPVIRALSQAGAAISADTRHASTMSAALLAGARIINDVSGLTHDRDSKAVVAKHRAPVVIMHMRGSPLTMNRLAEYNDVVAEVLAELLDLRAAAVAAGIAPERIALDPGFGFAKLGEQNVQLLRATRLFAALGHPLLIGVSRKKFIGESGGEPDAGKRGPGSVAAGLYAVAQGAHILRVHDVAETVQALRVWQRLRAGEDG